MERAVQWGGWGKRVNNGRSGASTGNSNRGGENGQRSQQRSQQRVSPPSSAHSRTSSSAQGPSAQHGPIRFAHWRWPYLHPATWTPRLFSYISLPSPPASATPPTEANFAAAPESVSAPQRTRPHRRDQIIVRHGVRITGGGQRGVLPPNNSGHPVVPRNGGGHPIVPVWHRVYQHVDGENDQARAACVEREVLPRGGGELQGRRPATPSWRGRGHPLRRSFVRWEGLVLATTTTCSGSLREQVLLNDVVCAVETGAGRARDGDEQAQSVRQEARPDTDAAQRVSRCS